VTATEPLSARLRLCDDPALRMGARVALGLLWLSGPGFAAGHRDRPWILAAGPEAATSESARIAPGPSERTAPAAPEIRQAPPGGGNDAKPDDTKPDDAKLNDSRRGDTGSSRASGVKSHD